MQTLIAELTELSGQAHALGYERWSAAMALAVQAIKKLTADGEMRTAQQERGSTEMDVKFVWHGSQDKDEGMAKYSVKDSTFAIMLPSFEKARQLEGVLQAVFAEGRRTGHSEMMRSVSRAMNSAASR